MEMSPVVFIWYTTVPFDSTSRLRRLRRTSSVHVALYQFDGAMTAELEPSLREINGDESSLLIVN
jgi:hypothetical protein